MNKVRTEAHLRTAALKNFFPDLKFNGSRCNRPIKRRAQRSRQKRPTKSSAPNYQSVHNIMVRTNEQKVVGSVHKNAPLFPVISRPGSERRPHEPRRRRVDGDEEQPTHPTPVLAIFNQSKRLCEINKPTTDLKSTLPPPKSISQSSNACIRATPQVHGKLSQSESDFPPSVPVFQFYVLLGNQGLKNEPLLRVS